MPTIPSTHNQLAWYLALGGHRTKAFQEASIAVRMDPKPYTYDTLAMALALSNQGQKAFQLEKKHVLDAERSHPPIANDTLGMIYYSEGRRQDALSEWWIARNSDDMPARRLATEFEREFGGLG